MLIYVASIVTNEPLIIEGAVNMLGQKGRVEIFILPLNSAVNLKGL